MCRFGTRYGCESAEHGEINSSIDELIKVPGTRKKWGIRGVHVIITRDSTVRSARPDAPQEKGTTIPPRGGRTANRKKMGER